MKFNQEYFVNVFADARELTKSHHSEVEIFKGEKLEIDVNKYLNCEEHGALKVFTARVEGKLVGYSTFFLYTHSHHLNTVHASQDTLYIHPDHRGVGLEFCQYCDEQLKLAGVKHVHRSMPVGSLFIEKLASNGYEIKEINLIRSLS